MQATSPPHQEQVPRKHGLKPTRHVLPHFHLWTSRASSTKTRIETRVSTRASHPYPGWTHSSRASSTKTRIETQLGGSSDWSWATHQEQVPRKQGLKHFYVEVSARLLGIIIKSKFHENKDWNFIITPTLFIPPYHQEQVPRKQGLKHNHNYVHTKYYNPSRASSTKTRIETAIKEWARLGGKLCIKSKFHENKDWNRLLLLWCQKGL